jgi:hypothetical protein
MTDRSIVVGVGVALVLGAAYVVAGPLDPPAGPVAETSPSLSDLESAIAGVSGGGEPLDGREFVDTATQPGSATDGKPLPLAGIRDARIDVEIESVIGPTPFAIVDIGSAMEVLEFQEGGAVPGVILVPGDQRFEISCIRALPTGTQIDEWFQDFRSGQSQPRDAVIIFRDFNNLELARYNCTDCLPAAIDVRNVDGEAVQQLLLRCELVERVLP